MPFIFPFIFFNLHFASDVLENLIYSLRSLLSTHSHKYCDICSLHEAIEAGLR